MKGNETVRWRTRQHYFNIAYVHTPVLKTAATTAEVSTSAEGMLRKQETFLLRWNSGRARRVLVIARAAGSEVSVRVRLRVRVRKQLKAEAKA